MSRRRLHPLLLLAAVSLVAAGCGGDGGTVPAGAPAEVVRRAPELTRAEGTARVSVIDGRRERVAVVDLDSPGRGLDAVVAGLLAELASPERVLSYGGQQVRGVPAFRYDVRVRRGGELETVGVWVDRQGRIRRIQLRSLPPATVRGGLPRLTVADFIEFGARLPS